MHFRNLTDKTRAIRAVTTLAGVLLRDLHGWVWTSPERSAPAAAARRWLILVCVVRFTDDPIVATAFRWASGCILVA